MSENIHIKEHMELEILKSFPILMMLLVGCSAIDYTSGGSIPVYFSHQNDHFRKRVLQGEVYTFLWGLFPKEHKVYLDTKFREQGLLSVSNVQIEEYQTTSQRINEILSFGMFSIKSYSVRGYGKEARDYEK